MLNRVILMGRLTKDPELRTTNTGISVCTFSIAVDRRFSGKGEERKTDFFNIVAWRQTADFIAKFFTKGKCICVQGEIQNRSYVDKDGNTRYITEIIADSAHFTGEKSGSSGADYKGAYSQAPHPAETANAGTTMASGNAGDFVETDNDDDYPF